MAKSIEELAVETTTEDVQSLLLRPESRTLEFKVSVPDVATMARVLSGFANTAGGVLLVGVKELPELPAVVIGRDYLRVQQVFDRAYESLKPKPEVRIHRVNVHGKDVAAIIVRPMAGVVSSASGAFVRRDDKLQPITVADIEERVGGHTPQAIHSLAIALEANTQRIGQLEAALAYASTLRGQWKAILMGFFLGIVASLIASAIFKLAGG